MRGGSGAARAAASGGSAGQQRQRQQQRATSARRTLSAEGDPPLGEVVRRDLARHTLSLRILMKFLRILPEMCARSPARFVERTLKFACRAATPRPCLDLQGVLLDFSGRSAEVLHQRRGAHRGRGGRRTLSDAPRACAAPGTTTSADALESATKSRSDSEGDLIERNAEGEPRVGATSGRWKRASSSTVSAPRRPRIRVDGGPLRARGGRRLEGHEGAAEGDHGPRRVRRRTRSMRRRRRC